MSSWRLGQIFNIQRSIVFLYTDNEQSENKIKKTISLIIVRITYPDQMGYILGMQGCFNKNQ